MNKTAINLANQLRFLRSLGKVLQNDICAISKEERKFLGDALINIGNGLDPKIELGVNVSRGQMSAHNSIKLDNKIRTFCGWFHIAMLPFTDGGLEMTLEEAVAECAASGGFGLTEETMRTYGSRYKEYREEIFEL